MVIIRACLRGSGSRGLHDACCAVQGGRRCLISRVGTGAPARVSVRWSAYLRSRIRPVSGGHDSDPGAWAGARVEDLDGNWFVEYGMGLRSITLGHGYGPVVAAVCNAAAQGVNFHGHLFGNCVPPRTFWHRFRAQTW